MMLQLPSRSGSGKEKRTPLRYRGYPNQREAKSHPTAEGAFLGVKRFLPIELFDCGAIGRHDKTSRLAYKKVGWVA